MKKFIGILLFALVAQSGIAQNTFHGSVTRTGSYNSPGPQQLKGAKWKFKTGGPITASPAVVNGTIYIGSADGFFYAIDQNSGKEIWRFKTEGPIASSAAVVDGVAYFGSYDGYLYALNIRDGALKWRFAMDFEKRFEIKGLHGIPPKNQTIPEAYDFFTSSPAVWQGKVFFGSGDGNVYSVDATSGKLQWKFTTGSVVHTSPSVADGTVFVGSWNSNLYAIDALSGKEKWRFEAGRDPEIHNQEGFTSSPAVVDGTVYVGCRDSHLYALNASTGRKNWEFSAKGAWISATPAIQGNSVFFTTGASQEFPAGFVALDRKNGQLKFKFDIKAGGFSSAAISDDVAYFGNTNGRLYAVDTTSGQLIWEFQTDSSKEDLFKVLNPDGSFKDSLTSFTFHDFQDRYVWMHRRFSIGAIVSSPVIDRGEIYFGSTDGLLYALY